MNLMPTTRALYAVSQNTYPPTAVLVNIGVVTSPDQTPYHHLLQYAVQDNVAWSDLQSALQAAQSETNNYLTDIINRMPQQAQASKMVVEKSSRAKRFKSAEFKGAVRSQAQNRVGGENGCAHGFPYSDKECLYSCSHWSHRKLHPNQIVAQYVKRVAQASAKNKAVLPAQLDIPYGSTPNQRIDIFGADALPCDAPVLAFIHGGYWQEGSRQLSAFMAGTMTSSGAVYCSVGYDLAPRATLDQMVNQIVDAIGRLSALAKSRGSRGLYICGHSAGAHLTTMALLKCGPEVLENIRGLFLLSGIYDLEPIVDTYITKPLKLNMDAAVQFSPERYVDELVKRCASIFIAVAAAEFDSPVFMDNNKRFYELLCARSPELKHKPEFHTVAGEDHFSIIERLDEKNFSLSIMMLRWMGI